MQVEMVPQLELGTIEWTTAASKNLLWSSHLHKLLSVQAI